MRRREHIIKTLTTSQVAWLLGIDSKAVHRWADSGIINEWRNACRGDRRFKRDEISNLLEKLGA
ncbi:helix-turn-helix domain-containing protein [Chloroflexota bacterium]